MVEEISGRSIEKRSAWAVGAGDLLGKSAGDERAQGLLALDPPNFLYLRARNGLPIGNNRQCLQRSLRQTRRRRRQGQSTQVRSEFWRRHELPRASQTLDEKSPAFTNLQSAQVCAHLLCGGLIDSKYIRDLPIRQTFRSRGEQQSFQGVQRIPGRICGPVPGIRLFRCAVSRRQPRRVEFAAFAVFAVFAVFAMIHISSN